MTDSFSHKRRRSSALLGAAMTAAWLLAGGTALADPRPVVVELYTSQGCSSCPPADALLGELAHRSGVLPLAFHVDYWDDLGWRDAFSSAEATRRQKLYAAHLGLDSIYTPQMVIDGVHDVVGSYRSDVLRLIDGPHEGVSISARRNGQDLTVSIGQKLATPTQATGTNPSAVVLLVAYTGSAETKVPRGENAGKTLREFNIVRGFWRLGDWVGAAQELHFDTSKLPEGTTDLALLLQTTGPGAMLGATSVPAH